MTIKEHASGSCFLPVAWQQAAPASRVDPRLGRPTRARCQELHLPSVWSPARPARNGACRQATTATSATARSTRSRPRTSLNLRVITTFSTGIRSRPRRPAARIRQHDVRRHAVSKQSHRRGSHEARRRREMDLRATSRFTGRWYRLLRRRQPRRLVRRRQYHLQPARCHGRRGRCRVRERGLAHKSRRHQQGRDVYGGADRRQGPRAGGQFRR